jgi:hypothetical protein
VVDLFCSIIGNTSNDNCEIFIMERYIEPDNHPQEQAKSMARFMGIELSQGQIDNYKEARLSKDENVNGLSDQEILYLFLDTEQRAVCEATYSTLDIETLNHLIWG